MDKKPTDQASAADGGVEQSIPQPATPAATKRTERTTGLRLFDVFLYPFLTNFAVFGISVAATYLTSKGGERNAAGKLIYGEFGGWMARRGQWMDSFFTQTLKPHEFLGNVKFPKFLRMNKESAEMARMVFFSFADGTLFAPFVKFFEDRREKIGKWVDDRLGTTPVDTSVYREEPKQTWGSVVTGRLATVALVVPIAVALDKLHVQGKSGQWSSLNDALFRNPGIRTGEKIAQNPKAAKWFGKLDIRELFKVSYFELFYTSVCTGGLYVLSRGIARLTGKHDAPATPVTQKPAHARPLEQPEAQTEVLPKVEARPATKITDAAHADRLIAPQLAASLQA